MIITAPCIFCTASSSVVYPPVTALLSSTIAEDDEVILKQIQERFGNSLEAINSEDKAGIVAYLTLYAVENFFICDITLSDKAEALMGLAEQLSTDAKLKLAGEIIQNLRA